MKSFSYRFETILRIKKIKETIAIKNFAEHQQMLSIEQEKLGALTLNWRNQSVNIGATAVELLHQQYYREKLSTEIKRQEQELAWCENNTDEAHRELVGCVQEKKIFEKLKEHAQHQYIKDMAARDQRQLDELGTVAYLNRSR